MAKLCQVCTTAEAKYKCPGCRAPYCSAACYKAHKEVPCAPAASAAPANASAPLTASTAAAALASATGHQQQQHPLSTSSSSNNSSQQPSLSAYSKKMAHEELVVDAAQLLSAGQLDALRALPIVHTSVENPAIRALLTKIDTSSDRLKELEKALLDPTFAGFMYQTLDHLPAKTT